MNLIVVTDIFGETSALHELVSSISEPYETSMIVGPYDDSDVQFADEEGAYQAFQKYCGLARLSDKLEKEIEQQTEPVDIVGFSVGATCAWSISGKGNFKNIRQITCFYGSRIRDHLSVTPEFPTNIIFPEHEKGFDIEPVIEGLESKPKTEIIRTGYLHGFMNKKSINFSGEGYRDFSRWLVQKAAQQVNQSHATGSIQEKIQRIDQ